MNYFLLLSLFAFLHSLSAQSYSGCSSYYYSGSTLCCYKISYSYSYYYYSYYYSYCPYYTTTSAPATTSLSNYCRSYYYSYYYSSRCCYYSSNYYYTTGDCDLATTTTQAPSSCYYYYYNSYYRVRCCTYRDYSYNSATYDQYCPSKSTLSSQCGSRCCTAYAPVYNGYETFYYSQYFCPSSPNSIAYSYCGSLCGMAAAFGTLGFCCCICGLGFTIGFIILITQTLSKKKKVTPNQTLSVPANQPISAGLRDSTIEMKQNWKQETLPPQIPGYTYISNPANTTDLLQHPIDLGGATNISPNPVYVPRIETHGAAPYPTFSQPVATDTEETYLTIN